MRKVKTFFKKDSTQAVCMLAPMLAGFLTFTYFPILYILKYAFYRFDGFRSEFIGIENFVRVFTRDPAFWESLMNTLVLSAGKLLIEIPLALLLALLLYQAMKGSGFFRVMLFLPTIISPAIIGLIFSLMFAGYQGVVNGVLTDLGMISRAVDWFSQKGTAMFVLGLASVWASIGINIIFFLMALQSIPKELHECARLDGAGGFKKFRYVTLPMIGSIFRVVLLNAIIGSLKISDLVLSSTNGKPDGKTEVVMTYVFKYFFGYGGRKVEAGYASAMAVVTAVFLGIITLIYLKSSKKMAMD